MSSGEAEAYHRRCREFVESAAAAADIAVHASNFYSSLAAPTEYETSDVSANGVRSIWVVPGSLAGPQVLLYFHGGGYISGSPESHATFAAHLARRLGARALLPDYRLVPHATFPAQIEDCLAAYKWLLSEGFRAENIVFAGESAGGALVVSTQLLAVERGVPLPAAGFAMSPWVDPDHSGESYRTNVGRDLLVGDGEISKQNFRTYMGPASNPQDPLLNPFCADLSKIAPLFAQSGGDELLRDDAVTLIRRATDQGAVAELQVVPGMQHMFQLCAGNMPEADAALDAGAAFLKRFLARAE